MSEKIGEDGFAGGSVSPISLNETFCEEDPS